MHHNTPLVECAPHIEEEEEEEEEVVSCVFAEMNVSVVCFRRRKLPAS